MDSKTDSVSSGLADSASVKPISHIARLLKALGFLCKVFKAIDFVSSPGMGTSQGNIRIRLAKTGAVLVGFMIFHSLPNLFFLFKNHAAYDTYGADLSKSSWVVLVEIFLLLATVGHILLSLSKTEINKPQLFTGVLIAGLVWLHLVDFRFSVARSDSLASAVLETVDRHKHVIKYLQYWSFILVVLLHAFRGVSVSWLSRLGLFEEARILMPLTRVLLVVSTALYAVPLIQFE